MWPVNVPVTLPEYLRRLILKSKVSDAFNIEEPVTISLSSNKKLQIFAEAAKFYAEELQKNNLDLFALLGKKGIQILRFSEFKKENLERLQTLGITSNVNSLCFTDEAKAVRFIAYNDFNITDQTEQLLVILHEYAHLYFNHTEHCSLAEAEASCFAFAVAGFVKSNQGELNKIITSMVTSTKKGGQIRIA